MLILSLLAAATAGDYRALGTEPFWSLTIGNGRIRLEEVGRGAIMVTAPEATRSRGGYRYVHRRMTVRISHRSCSDGMSDRSFPDTVTVVIGRRTLHGCGGVPTAPA